MKNVEVAHNSRFRTRRQALDQQTRGLGARRGRAATGYQTHWYELQHIRYEDRSFSIGICFGHQIIARALGGECVLNDGKWEIGTFDIDLTEVGKAVFQTAKSTIVSGPHILCRILM